MIKFFCPVLRRRLGWLALAVLLTPLSWAETIPAYNTYNTPPFITTSGGFAPDLIDYLNRKLHGQFVFKLQTLPRNRLNQVVMAHPEKFGGVVLFANKVFMHDADGTRYLWSTAVLEDANLVVSNRARPVEYQGPQSLRGLRFGGVNGHLYEEIDELAKQQALSREDADDERLNLAKLSMRRIDVTLLPQSLYRYLQRHHSKSLDALYVAAQPHSVFVKQILISPSRPDIAKALQPVLSRMTSDAAWQAILVKYNLAN